MPDDEATTINYDNLLRDMQSGAEEENAWRRENNYPTVTLVGWAEAPHYDQATHKIYWARDLLFGGENVHSLNYDIRVLGREGHLVVSFVTTMDQLETIRAEAPAVMAMANFTPGNTYADYREGVDQRAAYGIGGLIAGGALAAVAQKTGILAVILAFAKKFIVVIIAGRRDGDAHVPPRAAGRLSEGTAGPSPRRSRSGFATAHQGQTRLSRSAAF